MSHGRLVRHEHGRRPEHVAERVVEQVEHGGGVNVRVADHLRREERLARPGAEQAAHDTVRQVHLVSHFPHGHSHFAYVRLHFGRAVQVPR